MSKIIVTSVFAVAACVFLVGCDGSGANSGAPKPVKRDTTGQEPIEDPGKMNPGVMGTKK